VAGSIAPNDPELLTPEEAARRLSVPRTKVYQLLARGELRSVKVGRLRRVVTRSLSEYIDRESD